MTLPLIGILIGGIWLYSAIKDVSVVSIFMGSPSQNTNDPTLSGAVVQTGATASTGAGGPTGATNTNTNTAQGSPPTGSAPAPSVVSSQSMARIEARFLADLNRTRPPASDLAGSGWQYTSDGSSIVPTPGNAGAVARQDYAIGVMDGQIGQP